LPSGGSFDREKLQHNLDKVVDRHPDNRDAEVSHALESSRSDTTHTSADAPNALPGHKTVTAEVQLAKGTEIGTGKDKKTVGGVTVTETRQVLDPDADADEVAAASGGQAVQGEHSEVLSVDDASGAVDEAAAPAGGE
jgi:hypothetical protein